MSTTLAVLKGRFGTTEYFVLAMKAKELVEKAIIPSDKKEEWEALSLEEREQRDINYARVKKQIAPYLVRDEDRFFGAIILAAKNLRPDSFEPIDDVAMKKMPNLYKTQAQLMGFLTLQGDEVLIPLDGQHRLKALEFAIEGRDEKGAPISGLSPDLSLASEDVTVILVPYDLEKARKIFTKVNRYAKSTTTGQDLVTDDDDIIAILSRLVANNVEIIGPDLVNYKTNTLSEKAGYFTTLATIAECNIAILEANFPERIDRTKAVESQSQRMLYEKKVIETWSFLVENINLFADVLEDKEETGDDKRREIRQDYLLGKPVAQLCLVKAFVRLTTKGGINYSQAASKLNSFDWRKSAKIWDRLLMSGGRIQGKNKKLATEIICYLAGEKLDEESKSELQRKYRDLFPDDRKGKIKLPEPLA